ncbi:rho GTPase-activating protein 11B-like [Gouania willdenowi]|uniref:rho GTPase-activating protein 11B-like n=1 Tax=Gouania willdenowi TaxID=441366 RepID=UPI001055446C|nr:rho GTPase-activating protein 11A [Gouania willdenowi]
MTVTDKNMIQFHLEVLYGVSVKILEKKKERSLMSATKIFGVPLGNSPRCYVAEFGLVPCFLVDACSFLLERAGTVGLFRKPGSLPRIKILRDKLNGGEGCLSTALPYDVATLIKQFCRELPEPLFPSELHASLLEAQGLPRLQDRTEALQLLSCLVPARSASCLHYLFDFLSKVSQRCTENLMTSSNLATIFAPCLLPPPNMTEMSEGRLELRVLVLRTFIENPHLFGVIPKAVKDCMEYMNFYYPGDAAQTRGNKKRHSFKVTRSAKMVSWMQGRSKVKLSAADRSQRTMSEGRPTLRRSFGMETFPSIKLFRTSPDDDLRPSDVSTSADKESCITPKNRIKRDLGHFRRFSKGQTADGSPLLTAVEKLPLWRRRISI